jgi:hypothetical protein
VNLTLIIRSWRNRYQGSEMHSVEIVRDGHFFVAKLNPLFTDPVHLACEWLSINGLITARIGEMTWHEYWHALEKRPYITRCNVANKSDL